MHLVELPKFRIPDCYGKVKPHLRRSCKFRLNRGLRIRAKGITNRIICFHDRSGHIWGRIDQYGFYIEEFYAWGGMPGKVHVPVIGVWVGVPDFGFTRIGSLLWDFYQQFGRTEHFPLSRTQMLSLVRDSIVKAGEVDLGYLYADWLERHASKHPIPHNDNFSTLL